MVRHRELVFTKTDLTGRNNKSVTLRPNRSVLLSDTSSEAEANDDTDVEVVNTESESESIDDSETDVSETEPVEPKRKRRVVEDSSDDELSDLSPKRRRHILDEEASDDNASESIDDISSDEATEEEDDDNEVDEDDEDDEYDNDNPFSRIMSFPFNRNKTYIQQWFHNWHKSLSPELKDSYDRRYEEIRSNRNDLPSIRDIIDLDIDDDTTKDILGSLYSLSEADALDPGYNRRCDKFIEKYNRYKDNVFYNKHKELLKLEKHILTVNEHEISLKERILCCEGMSDEIKAILYRKYLSLQELEGENSEERFKLDNWIKKVLSIPRKPVKLSFDGIDETQDRNLYMSKIVTRLYTEMSKRIYGLEEAKVEIICMVINIMNNPGGKYNSFALSGPPGVGKTMIVKIISEVLGVKYEKIALGGISNGSTLKGHDYTYIGADFGMITKALIKLGATNGLLYYDEVDKISTTDYGQEVSAAMLAACDYTQCDDYRDNYCSEIPIDLSGLINVFSMNSPDKVDPVLLSRLPVIHIDGYTSAERKEIVPRFLIPEVLVNYKIPEGDISFSNDAIDYLVQNVKEGDGDKCGVRELKSYIDRVVKRINLYRIASINGQLGVVLPFKLDDFKIPYVITTKIVISMLGKDFAGKQNKPYHSMYL
jgi:ATP-dependent Lon protease